MGYATLTDLTIYGAPSTAFGQLTSAQKQAALDQASNQVDTHIRGRYSLPLIAWGTEITEATCKIAAYNLLSIRGYNPASGADINIRDRYLDALKWLGEVQRQQAHPDITPQPDNTPKFNQPTVISKSVVNLATGSTNTNRGW